MINKTIGQNDTESEGILGCQGDLIIEYVFDRIGTYSEYIPDTVRLNCI